MRDQFDISWVFETTEFEIAQVTCMYLQMNKWMQNLSLHATSFTTQSDRILEVCCLQQATLSPLSRLARLLNFITFIKLIDYLVFI